MKLSIIFTITCLITWEAVAEAETTGSSDSVTIRDVMEEFEKREIIHMTEIQKLTERIETLESITTRFEIEERLGFEPAAKSSKRVSHNRENGIGQEQLQTVQRSQDSPEADAADRKQQRSERRVPTRRQTTEGTPAFFATLIDHMINITYNQSITFDNVITNDGNAYDPASGVFTAPVAGSYVFSTSLVTLDSHAAHYIMAKNGIAQSYMYVRGIESPGQTTSQTGVLDLDAGDNVEVMCIDYSKNLNGYGYSSFAGFLLRHMEHSSVIVG